MSREGQPPYSSPIVPEFQGRHTNFFAYPERGHWGDPRYPGNFSGKFVLDLIDLYKARSVADPFRGGGTTEDVCKEFGIPYWTGDLRDGFNILEDAIPACSDGTSPELVMFHPPYFDMIYYSGRVWGEQPDPADLSAAPTFDDFVRMANEAQYNAYSHVKQGGHVAILIGSIRRQGRALPAPSNDQPLRRPRLGRNQGAVQHDRRTHAPSGEKHRSVGNRMGDGDGKAEGVDCTCPGRQSGQGI